MNSPNFHHIIYSQKYAYVQAGTQFSSDETKNERRFDTHKSRKRLIDILNTTVNQEYKE